MHGRAHSSTIKRTITRWSTLACLLAVAAVAMGCKSVDAPNVEKSKTPVAAQAVQATLTVDSTSTGQAGDEAPGSVSPTSTLPQPGKVWPAKVGTFAKNFKGPVWYPTAIPKPMKIDALDVVEMEPGSGLVCDIVYYDGSNAIMFAQGSPKTRSYDIVSIAKVAWGDQQADVVHEDPMDKTSPKMIVLSKGGTLAELSGGTDFESLKAVAASMMPVR